MSSSPELTAKDFNLVISRTNFEFGCVAMSAIRY